MQLINGYWVDDNNNRWNCDFYDEDEAKKYSDNLTNCHDCWNCEGCRDCEDCWGCRDCEDCEGCWNCRDCEDCRGCRDCEDCWNCEDCRGCVTPRIGSRNANTTFYWLGEQTRVICGCFRGTIEEFEEQVKEVHGDNEHGKAYMAEIAKVRMMMQ